MTYQLHTDYIALTNRLHTDYIQITDYISFLLYQIQHIQHIQHQAPYNAQCFNDSILDSIEKKFRIDVFYHRFGNGIPGHTARAPP